MNGGAPALPLRAVRVSPVLVDDLAVVRALVGGRAAGGRADGDTPADTPPPDAAVLRWTRAWLVAWQAALAARGVIGTADAWTVALPRSDWPTLRGDPDRRRQAAAVELLARTRLAEWDAAGALRLVERAFVSHRAGLEVDWPAAYRACRAEPASLLTLRAVVDCLPALDDPGPITLRELAARTDYGEKQVRIALHRLVEARVLATREAAGQPTQYRLTDLYLGRGTPPPVGPALVPRRSPDPPAGAPDRAAMAPAPAPAAVGTPDARSAESPVAPSRATPAFRLSLNGATVALAAGLTASVELDPDGVPHLHVGAAPRP